MQFYLIHELILQIFLVKFYLSGSSLWTLLNLRWTFLQTKRYKHFFFFFFLFFLSPLLCPSLFVILSRNDFHSILYFFVVFCFCFSPKKKKKKDSAMKLRLDIEAWIAGNKLSDLDLKLVSDFLLEFSFGQQTFQVGTDDQWRPMFLTFLDQNSSELLSPINSWIEQQSSRQDFTVIQLLEHLNVLRRTAVGVGKIEEKSEDKSAAKFAAALEKMMQGREKKIKGEDGGGEGGNAPTAEGAATGLVAAVDAPAAPLPPVPVHRVHATAAHFDAEIIPALRDFLQGEHFQAYEIDEWCRRIQMLVARDEIDEALRVIHDEALNGSPMPNALAKFYVVEEPEEQGQPLMRQFELRAQRRNRVYYTRDGLSEEAAERLQVEAEGVRETNASRVLGWTASPVNSALAHWSFVLLGDAIDPSSPLGMQLVEWALNHHQSGGGNVVRPADVQVEMLMPFDFPTRGPTFRVISPRFKDVQKLNLSLSHSQTGTRDDLTVSRDLDAQWDPSWSLADIVARVRERLEFAELDMSAGTDSPLATVGGFWRSFVCMSPAAVGRPDQEHAGQITLPSSALEQLMNSGRRYLHDSGGGNAPMTFEISSNGGKRSFCGVAEFSAEEGSCIIPTWIQNNLNVKLGDEVQVRRVYVPKGIYMKLQPHDARYAKVKKKKEKKKFFFFFFFLIGF